MKTQAFNENGTMKSLEVAVVLSLISFAGYTLLKPEVKSRLFTENILVESQVDVKNPASYANPRNIVNTENAIETGKSAVNVKGDAITLDKNYIASPERLAEFLDEEKAKKLEERSFTIPEWIEKEMAVTNNPAAESTLATLFVNPATDELDRMAILRLYLVEEVEPPMEIGEWMLNESIFSSPNAIEAKSSENSKIEVWKIQNQKYGNRKFMLTQAEDKKLEIEGWMTDEKFWQTAEKKNETNKMN